MKSKKHACLLLIMFIGIISISAVSAAEDGMSDMIGSDINDESVLEEILDENILGEETQNSQSTQSDAENNSLSINPISDKQKANENKLESSNYDMTKGDIIGKFSDIQKQIDNAQPGDTIYLDAGIYTKDKHIKIYNKTNITIVGVKDSTVLDGLGKVIYEGQFTYPMIDIGFYSENVTIKDIIFVNSYYPKGSGAAYG